MGAAAPRAINTLAARAQEMSVSREENRESVAAAFVKGPRDRAYRQQRCHALTACGKREREGEREPNATNSHCTVMSYTELERKARFAVRVFFLSKEAFSFY